MIELDEQLQRLVESVELPSTAPEDDLARGKARRRQRNLGAMGAALATATVIGAGVALLAGGPGQPASAPGFAGGPSAPGPGNASASTRTESRAPVKVQRQSSRTALGDPSPATDRQVRQTLDNYRDILREDLDPAGTRIQTGPITNRQTGDDSLGTKLDWNNGGMLEVAVGRSLEGVQFFCDQTCTSASAAGATKAFVLTSPGAISVAVFQDDGDIVALTADTSFGNNGTSTGSLGLTVDQLLAAAADARLDLPDGIGQSSDPLSTR
jgi:hypothetical protein